MGFVGLYTVDEPGYPSGLLRFFDVRKDPPWCGRPRIEDTLSLKGMVDAIVERAIFAESLSWGTAEEDDATVPPLFRTESISHDGTETIESRDEEDLSTGA